LALSGKQTSKIGTMNDAYTWYFYNKINAFDVKVDEKCNDYNHQIYLSQFVSVAYMIVYRFVGFKRRPSYIISDDSDD
jgi:hypothetical protein